MGGFIIKRRERRVLQGEICAGQECRGYDSGQYVQETTAKYVCVVADFGGYDGGCM